MRKSISNRILKTILLMVFVTVGFLLINMQVSAKPNASNSTPTKADLLSKIKAKTSAVIDKQFYDDFDGDGSVDSITVAPGIEGDLEVTIMAGGVTHEFRW